MAFPILPFISGLVGVGQTIGKAVKQRKAAKAEAETAAEPQLDQSRRYDTGVVDPSSVGTTQGLALRPPFGSLGSGIGTIPAYPPLGAQAQQPPMFIMQQSGGQQAQQPAGQSGGNFSLQNLQGLEIPSPQRRPGQPQQAPAPNALSFLVSGRRGPYE